ncbi:MAG: DUF3944 domain-containing protein [Paludibacteraceae bacterium]|nr:DUF3944 domain-containing protein [Paludibacteraceae bacterium]
MANIDYKLLFLEKCKNDDLHILIDYLTHDKDGSTRISEELTGTSLYRTCYPNNLNRMWSEIAEEFQKFGGNTFVNMFRGGGPAYKEILMDVCDKLKVAYNKQSTVELIETNLLQSILISTLDEMNEEELQILIKELGNPNTVGSKPAMIATLQIAIKAGGFGAYKVAMIVANWVAKAILGRGLAVGANAGLTRIMAGFAGPIGWIITAIWTAIDLASPAYRVTIPACIQIAYMRAALNK